MTRRPVTARDLERIAEACFLLREAQLSLRIAEAHRAADAVADARRLAVGTWKRARAAHEREQERERREGTPGAFPRYRRNRSGV